MCSSRILVAPAAGNFQTAIFKFEVLLSIFCGTKITLEYFRYFTLDLTPPLLCHTHTLIFKFFQPLIIQYFEDSIPSISKQGGGVQTMKAFI